MRGALFATTSYPKGKQSPFLQNFDGFPEIATPLEEHRRLAMTLKNITDNVFFIELIQGFSFR